MDNIFLRFATPQSWFYILVLLTVPVKITVSLEEPRPAIYLQPRNFNPHPYEVAAQRRNKNGPVVFPSNPEDNLIESRSQFISARNFPVAEEAHPVDNHPYAKVARKHKYRLSGRYNDEDGQACARKALAKHGVKVLSYPPEKLAKYKDLSQQQAKDYAFSYKVVDHSRGDDFSHSQTRNSKATNGEYRVKLPDGRVQIVSYTADKNGYKADVKYTENGGVTDQRGASHHEEPIEIQRIPVRELYPVEEEKSDYNNEVQAPNHNIVVLQAVVPTTVLDHFDGHGGILVTPSPAYSNAVESRELQKQHYPKVEIYTTNARDYSVGSYIPSTVSPYPEKYSSSVNSRVISPVIINNGDHGLTVPSSPATFVLTDHQGLVLDNVKLVSTIPSPLVIGNHVTSTTPATLILSDLYSRAAPHLVNSR